MTEKEIYAALDLRDPDEFALERMRQNLSEEKVRELGTARAVASAYRGTGRTTRSVVGGLLSAMRTGRAQAILVSTGKAGEVSKYYMRDMIKTYANRLGQPELISLVVVVDAVMHSHD